MAPFLCLAALVGCYLAARRSLVAGLVTLLAIGYLYGIVRANLPDAYAHFIFDAGVIGFFGAALFRRLALDDIRRTAHLKSWLEFLIGWPLLIFLIPTQDLLVRIVGLRGNIFFLPFILIGARLRTNDKYRLALWLAAANIVVLAVALAEFFWGIERFFPKNEITKLIYLSKDLVGYTAYRIPSTFPNAHAYAGTMVMCLPFLAGALLHTTRKDSNRLLLIAGLIASLLGVFLAATRLHFVGAAVIVLVAIFSIKSRFAHLGAWLLIIAGIAWIVSGEQRLQRFTELKDTQMVSERVAGSINLGFFELAVKYPFGNGMGGGGTSMPYWLQAQTKTPVVMENEYARIMLEQGLLGLAIWIAFVVWLLMRRSSKDPNQPWFIGRRLAWTACGAYFVAGLIGTGLLTSIPQTCLFLLSVGWVAASPEAVFENSTDRSSREYSRAQLI